ncbi:MAG: DUF4129 domain-containing protein [Propionicimonas sp.]|uniref:DUF4129 domain-containing protein n=1 Tax=Propionicimonas sp. TaxID=1955623 RepID=UPI003D0D9238
MRPSATTIRVGVVAAIVLVVLGAASATPWVVTLTLPRFTSPDRPASDVPQMTIAPQEAPERDLPDAELLEKVLLVLAIVVAVALLVLGVAWLVRRLRDAWQPDDDAVDTDRLEGSDVLGEVAEVDIASLATAVARADAHLAGAVAPGDAVIAAWVALEDEATLQGAGRAPAQTATEFASELLARTPAPADAVAVLRGLYHRARFTSRPVAADDVRRARVALSRIAEALDAHAAQPAEAGDTGEQS